MTTMSGTAASSAGPSAQPDEVTADSPQDHSKSHMFPPTVEEARPMLSDRALSSSSLTPEVRFRVYKRRWFGLVQLTLLNIVVSWSWLTFAPISTTSAEFFGVSIAAINWLSTAFLFAFVAAAPATILVLNRSGPKTAIVTSSIFVFVGSWIRYAGTRASNLSSTGYGIVMFGQILIGFAQPFVLAAPTRYSEDWFTAAGRIAATALPSLANPFGGALGQLIDPFWATQPSDVSSMTLYVSIISTIICIPSVFIPARPPSPPSAVAARDRPAADLAMIITPFLKLEFHLLFWPFAVYVSCFNALSTLLNNILFPYGFSETNAGIAGALLIVVGLVAAAIASPILDRSPSLRLPFIKVATPIIAACYLVFVWVPQTRSVAAAYIICAILGAGSFALVPLALEYLAEVTWPEVGTELTSTICWTGGQIGGAVFIIIMDAMSGLWKSGEPSENLKAGLVLMAVAAWVVLPLPLALGIGNTGRRRREEAEVWR